MKRFFLLWIIAAAFAAPAAATDEAYPTRPIEIIVGFAPGGATDLAARAVASVIPEYLGKPAVVVNKPGGGGTVGGEYITHTAKPDGYSVWHSGITIAAPELYVKFKPATFTSKDVEPICSFAAMIGCFTVRADAPWNNISDLVEHVRKHPGLKFSGPGVTTGFQLLGQALGIVTKTRFASIPLKGDGESVSMLLGKHVDMAVMSLASAKPQIEAKKFKVLGVVAPFRLPDIPNVATLEEQGFDVGIGYFSIGAFVPKGTPAPVIAKLAEAHRKVCENKSFIAQMDKLGLPVVYEGTDKYRASFHRDLEGFHKMFVELGYLPKPGEK
ncbi:MAG TPA: tripartite tricarboxylate transporter substrate binding protein [Thermodesulfobacteriota bacterium]|nr:tripartite tricarboxylate transporter substrate binding protein [Thermodesulfobacteriota bacterium]